MRQKPKYICKSHASFDLISLLMTTWYLFTHARLTLLLLLLLIVSVMLFVSLLLCRRLSLLPFLPYLTNPTLPLPLLTRLLFTVRTLQIFYLHSSLVSFATSVRALFVSAAHLPLLSYQFNSLQSIQSTPMTHFYP